MDEKRLRPLDSAAQILALYRRLPEKRKLEFMALAKELFSTMPEENSADQALTSRQDS